MELETKGNVCLSCLRGQNTLAGVGRGGGLGPSRWLSGLCPAVGALARVDGTHVSDSLAPWLQKRWKKKSPNSWSFIRNLYQSSSSISWHVHFTTEMEIILQKSIPSTAFLPQQGGSSKSAMAPNKLCMDTELPAHGLALPLQGDGEKWPYHNITPWKSSEAFWRGYEVSLMSHLNQCLHPRPHQVISVWKREAQLHPWDCCLARHVSLQGGYEVPYLVAALMVGLYVCALGFGWLQAFCGLSLLSEQHLLEASKNIIFFSSKALGRISGLKVRNGWLFWP